ncbi:MAG: class I SAM-dependent methyltransferase [Oligoflexia bacterium]|nr:class I SAM-dependent methyltransferase [Oligoflexia bacterium]
MFDDQKDYWDSVAYIKNFNFPFDHDVFGRYVNKNSKILDYGCGYGRILDEICQHGYGNLYGCDISGEMIERGKKEFPDFNLVRIDGSQTPYSENKFDAAILSAVLTWVAENEAQLLIMEEISFQCFFAIQKLNK